MLTNSMEKWKQTKVYKLYRAFSDWVKSYWDASLIVSWWTNPEEKIYADELRTSKLRKSACSWFERVGLKKLFTGSIFCYAYFWCALTLALAPVLPTMGVLALCAASFFSIILSSLYDDRGLKRMPISVYICLYCVMVAISVATSLDPKGSLYPALMYICFSIFAIALYHAVENKKHLELVVDLMILIAAVVSCYGIVQYVFKLGYQSSAWTDDKTFEGLSFRVTSTFQNPNMLGQYLILMIPIGGARFLDCREKFKKLFYFACCAVMCLCMILTFSRGAWLGLLFAAAVFFVMIKPQLILLFPFALAALYFVLPDSIISRFTSIGNLGETSTSYRVSIWKGTLEMLGDGAWKFGVGIGESAFKKAYSTYAYDLVVTQHSHNLFLQMVCDGGVIMLLIFLAILIVYVRTMCVSIYHESDRKYKWLDIAFLSGVLGFLVQGMTDYSFYNYRLMLIFFACLAVGCLCAKRTLLKEDGGILK